MNEEEEMARLTDPMMSDLGTAAGRGNGQPVRRSLEGKFVCPFCGTINATTDEPCPSCGMENTPATRNSTRGRVGPWYVLQKRNPAAPGMKFETLIKFIRKGRIQPKAVLRGPTTSQLWRFAATVKGVSREFGLCYNCGGDIDTTADQCPHCSRGQQPPADPDVLLETASSSKRPAPVRQPVAEPEVDFQDDFDQTEPAPARPATRQPAAGTPFSQSHAAPKQNIPTTPAAAFNSVGPINQPQPSPFSTMSREENDRREIEAGRRQREEAPRDPNRSQPTLNARELATAFQLDFTPSKHRHRRKRVGKLTATFLFLCLLGGAGTVAFFKVPQFHDWVLATYAQTYDKVQAILNPKPSVNDKPAAKVPDYMTLEKSPSAQQPRTEASKPAVIQKAPDSIETPPAPPVQVTPAVIAPPEPVVTRPAPVIVAPLSSKMSIDEAYDASRKLWRQALDFESRGEWAEAVATYEKIKTLPEKARQPSLTMRLDNARKKLAE